MACLSPACPSTCPGYQCHLVFKANLAGTVTRPQRM